MRYYYETQVKLGDYYLHLGEVFIGARFSFLLEKIKLSVLFPYFDSNQSVQPNKDMRIDWHWSDNHSPTYRAMSWNAKRVTEFECFEIIIQSDEKITKQQARKISNRLDHWVKRLLQAVEIMNKRDFTSSGVSVDNNTNVLACITDGENAPSMVKYAASPTITINMQAPLNDRTEFEKAIHFASSKKEMAAQFVFINSALRHFNNGFYREAVFDSATALEVALAATLDSQLVGMSKMKKQLIFDKYRGIGELIKGIKKLDVGFNGSGLINSVAEPRNKTIHGGKEIDKTTAQNAYKTARDFIYSNFTAI
jgi:hypothetical protein